MSDFDAETYESYGRVDDRGQVIRDTPCRRCAYNLRGLREDGRCPECGAPIGVSVCGDYLRFSHPRWLQDVAYGITLILWGMLISFVVGFAAHVMFRKEPAMQQFLSLGGAGFGLWGTWLMTQPDPGGIGETAQVNARKLVRAAVIAAMAGAVIQLMITLGGGVTQRVAVTASIQIILGLVSIVSEFAKLQYVGQLTARIPNEVLSSRAGSLKWAMVTCYGLLIALGGMLAFVAAMASRRSTVLGLVTPMACLAIPVGLALLVVSIMVIVLLYNTAQAIRAEIPVAISIWRSAQSIRPAEAVLSASEGSAVPAATRSAAEAVPQASMNLEAPASATGVVPLKVAHLAATTDWQPDPAGPQGQHPRVPGDEDAPG